MRDWTGAQKMAMAASGRTLLISAAAGSGKTSTLTERIIRRLTAPDHPADLSRILVVTFTRASAADLRKSIADALSTAIAANPGNRHLQNQLLGLGNAHISTIDSFCREPVKAQFAALGLPATTRIADDAELNPLKEAVLGGLIDEFYIKYASSLTLEGGFSLLENNPFADLCDALTSSKNDEKLIPTLLNLYDRLLSFPEELSRLRLEYEALEASADLDFFETDHGKIIRGWLDEFLSSAIRGLNESLTVFSDDPKAVAAYYEPTRHDLDFCEALRDARTYAKTFELMTLYKNDRMGQYRGAPADIASAKDVRTAIVDDIKDLRKRYFVDDPTEIRRQVLETAQMCHLLYDLLTAYDEAILAAKRERGITDFTDNRRFLLKLLRDENGEPSAFAKAFAAEFDEVYIDEYQDVDEMQDEIFRIVGGNHRFMVGDIKQSIYGFRGADPSVFSRYRASLAQMEEDENGNWSGEDAAGNSIFMSNNFRCDESVIETTNQICGKMFRACPDSIGYKAADDLKFTKKLPDAPYKPTPAQVTVLVPPPRKKEEEVPLDDNTKDEESLVGVEAEAAYVANEIAKLLREPHYKAYGTERIRPEDIAILMRTTTAMPAFIKALTEMGIPTGSDEIEAVDAGKDLLHGTDMTYLVNLLRVIDNPDHDIPLAEVLRAPFPGLDLEELITLRNAYDRTLLTSSLYGNLEAYIERPDSDPSLAEKLSAFVSWLEGYRRLAASTSADGVLKRLRRDEKCASRQTKAFTYLYESARNCKASSFVSLYTFLKYFEKRIMDKITVAPEGGKVQGRVNIMTIHKSKGLEFPVCFVVRCGQYFSAKSQSKDLIFEKEAGAAMKLYRRRNPDGTACHAKVDTTLRAAAALSMKLTEREEEMRLLYVALTRARERLFLVGTASDKPFTYTEGDRFATLSCNSYMKWIRGGLYGCESSEYYNMEVIPAETVTADEPIVWRDAGQTKRDITQGTDWAAHYREILDRYEAPSEKEMILRRVPTKMAASKMQDKLLDRCIFYRTDLQEQSDGKLPNGQNERDGFYCDAQSVESIRNMLMHMTSGGRQEFDSLLSASRRPTASERGTATHLFLQYCDYRLVKLHGVGEEIARLVSLGFMDERSARCVDEKMLEAFFASSFFGRISTAQRIEREKRFARFVPLSELTDKAELAEALGDRSLFVQGSIDLIAFYEDGSMEICDYKTDAITSEERRDLALLQKRMQLTHGEQLKQYVSAAKELYGDRHIRVSVFSLPLGESLEIRTEE